jgi:hypothetical protein
MRLLPLVLALAVAGLACDDPKPRPSSSFDGNPAPDAGPDTPDPEDVADPDAAPDVPDAEPEGPVDTDADGVSDEDEITDGTDPNNPDSDGDGYWDGWERAADTDPNDAADHPEYALPPGEPFLLEPTRFIEPGLLAPLVNPRLDSIPPILVYIEGLSDGVADEISIVGGVGEEIGPGEDDVPGNEDDEYGMRYTSVSQQTGAFLVSLDGTVTALEISVVGDVLRLDLSGISDLTEGVRLRIEGVELDGTFTEDLARFNGANLRGNFTRDGVAELAEQFQDFIPLDPDLLTEQLDPDGDGNIPVHLTLKGRRVVVPGFVEAAGSQDPIPRDAGACCPEGAEAGDPVEPFLAAGVVDQGLQPREEALAMRAFEALLGDPEVQMVATVRVVDGGLHYFVHGATGHIVYVRDGDGWTVIEGEGDNPLANTDPSVFGTYEEFIANGTNPENTAYPDANYPEGDPRLRWVRAEDMHFPFAFERIAGYFADPRAGDLAIIEVSYASGGWSSHGHLGAIQSRSPLLIAGAGVRSAATEAGDDMVVELPGGGQGLFHQGAARGVDIAPTLAAALGVTPHALGVREGYFRTDALLARQDGRVLEEVFTADALAKIQRGEPVAQHALIIINDGLTALEINHELVNAEFEVPAYRALVSRGMSFQFGSITNWPSNTYPSHNMIGAGAYSGHHGILDNAIYERETATQFSVIAGLFDTQKYFGSAHASLPVETLFEAVERSFPDAFTASINDPTSRGADFATLERRLPEGLMVPDSASEITIGGTTYPLPPADTTDFEALVDNASVFSLAGAYAGDLPYPKYVIANFSSTDGAGHGNGPHGDQIREHVLPNVSQRLEAVWALLEDAGILDQTIIVLTSDHGMEMKDTSRSGSTTNQLDAAGIKYIKVGAGIFFKTLSGSAALEADTLTVTVVDEDTVGQELPVPVAGVQVTVTTGADEVTGVTDQEGTVVLALTSADGALALTLTHDDFNPAELLVE